MQGPKYPPPPTYIHHHAYDFSPKKILRLDQAYPTEKEKSRDYFFPPRFFLFFFCGSQFQLGARCNHGLASVGACHAEISIESRSRSGGKTGGLGKEEQAAATVAFSRSLHQRTPWEDTNILKKTKNKKKRKKNIKRWLFLSCFGQSLGMKKKGLFVAPARTISAGSPSPSPEANSAFFSFFSSLLPLCFLSLFFLMLFGFIYFIYCALWISCTL